jgi:hypothetical protein
MSFGGDDVGKGLAQRQTGVIGRDGDDHLDAPAAAAAAS